MASISVSYGALSGGHDGLIATWNRIEGHLAELDATIARTSDMSAETLVSYLARKDRWDASATQRQAALQSLAASVGQAGERYRQVDAAMAAQFG
jgi:uncharacterized protein YukE